VGCVGELEGADVEGLEARGWEAGPRRWGSACSFKVRGWPATASNGNRQGGNEAGALGCKRAAQRQDNEQAQARTCTACSTQPRVDWPLHGVHAARTTHKHTVHMHILLHTAASLLQPLTPPLMMLKEGTGSTSLVLPARSAMWRYSGTPFWAAPACSG
jgi:hypothetical protein